MEASQRGLSLPKEEATEVLWKHRGGTLFTCGHPVSREVPWLSYGNNGHAGGKTDREEEGNGHGHIADLKEVKPRAPSVFQPSHRETGNHLGK